MSDPTLSDNDFKNIMAWVWTTLNYENFELNWILGFNDEQNELNNRIKNAAHKLTVKLEKIKDQIKKEENQIKKNKASMTTEHRIKKTMVRWRFELKINYVIHW